MLPLIPQPVTAQLASLVLVFKVVVARLMTWCTSLGTLLRAELLQACIALVRQVALVTMPCVALLRSLLMATMVGLHGSTLCEMTARRVPMTLVVITMVLRLCRGTVLRYEALWILTWN